MIPNDGEVIRVKSSAHRNKRMKNIFQVFLWMVPHYLEPIYMVRVGGIAKSNAELNCFLSLPYHCHDMLQGKNVTRIGDGLSRRRPCI